MTAWYQDPSVLWYQRMKGARLRWLDAIHGTVHTCEVVLIARLTALIMIYRRVVVEFPCDSP